MQKLQQKLIRLFISMLTFPFRLITRGLVALFHLFRFSPRTRPSAVDGRKSSHRNGQSNATSDTLSNYRQLVAEANHILEEGQPRQLTGGIMFSPDQVTADLADFDNRLKTANRSHAQKAAWARRRQTQVQAELDRQQAEQARAEQLIREQLKAKRTAAAKAGWQTRRHQSHD